MSAALSVFRGVICRMRNAPSPRSITAFANFVDHYHADRPSDREFGNVADKYNLQMPERAFSTFGCTA